MSRSKARKTYRIFMVDADIHYCKLIRDSFYNIKRCDYIGYASNGISGYYSILASKPDIIILDYILPELDGIKLLDKIREIDNYYPYIIMFCGLGNKIIIQQVIINGANECSIKPCSVEELSKIILNSITKLDIEPNQIINIPVKIMSEKHFVYINEATLILRKISMPPHIKGYNYFRESIVDAIEDPTVVDNIMDKIYKKIADSNNTTANNVERVMRHAVEAAWNRCRLSIIDDIFGNTLNENKDKPSNKQVIAMLSDIIRVKHGLIK